ncbi:MAG: alpha/beta fold hydrolase [Acidimicrobiales bacterium]
MRIDVNGVGVSFEVTGDDDGRPVLLLHGFPDSHRLWRHQLEPLAEAGFRVIVPDLRRYGGSDKPEALEQYALPFLAADVLGILDHLGIERAHLVGHDWGAVLAWAIASLVPDRTDHVVAMSVGFPTALVEAGLPQRQKSWYFLLFQFEGIAERWLSADGWANFREWSSHPDADGVISELEANGSLTPALNWYRANIPPASFVEPPLELPAVAAPVMGIWSSGDFALTEEQMTGSQRFVTGKWRYERIEGAGHWMQLELPATVSALLLDFLPT